MRYKCKAEFELEIEADNEIEAQQHFDEWFAEAAMQGFVEAEKMGAFNIEKIISQCSG